MKQWQPSSLFNTTSRLRSPLCLYSPVGDKDRNRKEDPKPTLKSDHKLWLCEWKGAHLAGDCCGIETNPHFVKYQLFKWVLWNLLAYAVYVSFWFSKKGLTSLIFHAESKSLWRHIAAWWNQRKLLWLKLEWTFVQTVMAALRNFIKKTPAEKTSVCHGKTRPYNAFYVLYHESYLSYQKLKMFSLKADLILRKIKVYSTVCAEFNKTLRWPFSCGKH